MRQLNVPKPKMSTQGNFSSDEPWLPQNLRQWLPSRLLWTLLIVLVGLWLLSGFYVVGPGERGLVLTFGRLTGQ